MNRIHHTACNERLGPPHALALAVALAFSLPVQAADSLNTGGSWYHESYAPSCGAASNVAPDNSYLGACGAGSGELENRRVTIIDGAGGLVVGAYGTGSETVSGNQVIMQSGGVGAGVIGGLSDSGLVTGNQVIMTGGTVNTGGGIASWMEGGHSESGPATGNLVAISGGVVNGSVRGGYSYTGDVSDNRVLVSGAATIQGDVYGGVSRSGRLSGNRIVLDGAPTLTNSVLYGGFVTPGGAGTSSGNVLEIRTTGLTAKNARNFQEYHFILPADVTAGATALTLNDTAGTDLTNAKIGVALAAGGNVLRKDDQVTLIRNDSGLTTDASIQRAGMTGYQGVSLGYAFDVSVSDDKKKLYATVASGEPGGSGATVLEQTKAPVEGRAGTMALASQAGDLAGGAGMARAAAATEGVSGTATFGATAGGTSRYHSGSHVDTTGLSVMLGAAKRYPAATGQWMAGVFLEGGYGKYDTYNSFSGQPTVHGSGKSHYFGGGVLLRRDWAGAGQAGPYAEGSLRVGQVSSDWRSRDMVGSKDASYDTSALYYGAHLGAGYLLPLNEKTSLDAYAKGFWTHQDSDSVTIAGDPYTFKAMDSFRTRLGVRLNRAMTEQITAYVGAAWEHEFDGKARATTYGLDTPSPSLKGDTGVFELGFDMKPKADGPLTVGLGVQAYTGMREGLGGTAKLMWVF
ncbi:MAG: autotransporter outer membrane beta-barrel domain-containing protein [Castellaniella sp.]|uniref:autotransporter outer membrane beta-barrel domain-containing protein n=1 Tax=Castellaniella sp. TaxID=1955812 RepID=UPI003C76EE2F